MVIFEIVLAFILGTLAGVIGSMLYFYKGYSEMLRQLEEYEARLNELKKKVEDLLIPHEEESSPWPSKNPYITTPDGVVNYLRAKYFESKPESTGNGTADSFYI